MSQRRSTRRRHEPAGDRVGQALDRRACEPCASLDQADDLREHRVAPDARRAEQERAGRIERGADDLVADAFRTGSDSPVSIDSSSGRASTMTPSTGTFSPGRTRTRSPAWTSLEGDVHLAAVAHDARGARLEPGEAAHRAGGLGLGARLEPAPEEDEADDRRRRCRSRSWPTFPRRDQCRAPA